jgi:phosphopantothenoylcysteine decarboxylase/phosphopantothenate--cysteine ligase
MSNASPSIPADTSLARASRVLLGVSGGIAAYKSAELLRLMSKRGLDVTVVMTRAATEFVSPKTFQALSGKEVHTSLWESSTANGMPHIELTRHADLFVIAPATADLIAKLSHGVADDLMTNLVLARNRDNCPLLIAPAMNREMWEHPATQRNAKQLVHDGVRLLGPAPGDQACGEVGMGRMVEPELILEAALAALAERTGDEATGPATSYPVASSPPTDWAGIRVLLTAGPTVEPIDPVRAITNGSSGKMGYAIAAELAARGAEVTLVSGPTSLETPRGVKRYNISTASQMLNAVDDNLGAVDVFFAVAAVADYTPQTSSAEKIKKSTAPLTLTLIPTVDIVASVGARPQPPFIVGFAAETDNILENAAKKREKKRMDVIVANDARAAIGANANAVSLIDASGALSVAQAPKGQIAVAIIDFVRPRFEAWRSRRREETDMPAAFTPSTG